MARDLVEILLRARGGHQVASETRMASGGVDRLNRRLDLAGKAANRFGRHIDTAAKWAVRGGAAIATGLTYELYRATEAWENHAKIEADTQRVIQTTGGVANVTSQHVDRLANSIQEKAAVDDDAVAAGENMLLTFLRVRNEVGKGNNIFDRATGLAVDMAARFGGDTKRAFIQLGRALDDPIKGITALRRTGVSFTEAEREKIKTLEETGHHLKAQKLILAALDKQVGGSAQAQARPLDKLKQSWGDVEKVIGRGVSPVVNEAAKDLLHLSDKAQPAFDLLGRDLENLFNRKDLSLGDKLTEAGHITGRDLGPLVDEIKQGLKDAHLDDKLFDAIEWAIPRMADAFMMAGPAAVKALIQGFEEAGPEGKLLIAWFAGRKLGLGKLPGLLFGGRGGLGGGLLQRGGTPANPLFVVDIASGGGKSWIEDVFNKTKGPAAGAGATGALARWGGRALRFGKFAGPAGIAADALINADAGDFSPERNAGALSEVFGSERGRGPLRHYPDSHPTRFVRHHRDVVAHVDVPAIFKVEGLTLAETNARVRVVYKERG